MKKEIISIVAIVILPIFVFSQWSNNPYENTKISDTTGSQILPKAVSNSNGETYISWFSEFGDLNFDVYLQKIDRNGQFLWDKEGTLVSDHETASWVTDYSMILDADENVIIATQDKRTGTSNVYAYKISPDGEFLWGDNGIQLSNTTGFDPSPQVVLADNNEIIFAWSEEPVDTTINSPLNIVRVTPEGDKIWETVLQDSVTDFMLPQLLFNDQNDLIVSWITKSIYPDTLPGQENWMHVFAQKINWEGIPVWENNIQVDSGQLMSFLSLFTTAYLADDGTGGAYVMWQSFFTKGDGGQPTTYVNRLYNDGTLWAPNGYSVSTVIENYHAQPKMEYLENIGKLMVCWDEYHYDNVVHIDCWGVYGQMFDSAGQYVWDENGHEIVPLVCSLDTSYNVLHIDESSENNVVMIYDKEYLSTSGGDTMRTTQVYAKSINSDGDFVWSPAVSPVSLSNSNKYQEYLSNRVDDQWIIVWSDNISNPNQGFDYGIYAQNLNVDGKIGPLAIINNSENNISDVFISPNPASETISIKYNLLKDESIKIALIDGSGRIIRNFNQEYNTSGLNVKQINISDLEQGIYFIDIQGKYHHTCHKIIVK